MVSTAQRLPFEADGASLLASSVRDQAPALSSHGALARFEFEAGRGNGGECGFVHLLWRGGAGQF